MKREVKSYWEAKIKNELIERKKKQDKEKYKNTMMEEMTKKKKPLAINLSKGLVMGAVKERVIKIEKLSKQVTY